ncbi:MAG TPA: O-antigen ligase family protein, partial [Gemmatimonadaceae bacterium]|nr:O-antigen ligase family protein [Gemmatimonadaceae bacterium]
GLALTLLLLQVEKGPRRILLLLNVAGIAAAIARSGSRGGFIGIIAVGAAAFFLANTVSVTRRIVILAASCGVIMLGAPPGYWEQMNTMLTPKTDYNFSSRDGRKELMKRGAWYMSQYPVFGLGINNFTRAECTISPKIDRPGRAGPLRCTAPHNSFIQAGAELGYPGGLVWLSIVIGGIVVMLRLRGRLPESWRRANGVERFLFEATTYFPLAMIAFAVTAFFVSFAWMDPIYILAALMSGWYIAVQSQIAKLPPSEARALALAIGLIRKTTSGWRVKRSARWFGFAKPVAFME